MTEEEKRKIKKLSNEEKVETLAKFIALKSLNINKAYEYGYMLDDLLDTIQKQQVEIEKKDETIDLMSETINDFDIEEDICKKMGNRLSCSAFIDKEECKKCIRKYHERKVEEC